jgi:hypothetical protein
LIIDFDGEGNWSSPTSELHGEEPPFGEEEFDGEGNWSSPTSELHGEDPHFEGDGDGEERGLTVFGF